MYLFWTNSQAVATDVSIYEVGNGYFDEWIPLENDKIFIYTDYEVALVIAFWEGRSNGDCNEQVCLSSVAV